MVRFLIIGAVIAVAFTLYGLVDAAMTDASRSRGVPKPAWVVLVAVLPVIGAILWFTIGKHRGPLPATSTVRAPDDDPRFTGTRLSDAELDERVEELEDRLRQLDDEVYPGEIVDGRPVTESGVTGERTPGESAPERGTLDGTAPDRSAPGDHSGGDSGSGEGSGADESSGADDGSGTDDKPESGLGSGRGSDTRSDNGPDESGVR